MYTPTSTDRHASPIFVRDGYIGMLRIDALHRGGVVPAAFTKMMQVGDVYCDIMLVKDGRRSVAVTYETGVHLDPCKN